MEPRQTRSASVWMVVLVACITLLVYATTATTVSFDQAFFEQKYAERGIYGQFNDSVNLSQETAVLLEYLESGEGLISSDFFNEKEESHLLDVRGIYSAMQRATTVALVISIIAAAMLIITARRITHTLPEKEAGEALKGIVSSVLIWTGAAVDGIAVILAIVAATFSQSFVWFHRIFFADNTWTFDPATDNLIRMFPEQFFFDIFVRMVLIVIVIATVMLVAGYLMRLGKPRFAGD
ncbi:DUF1461 domain-containing protein [Candidatus Woesearchaeota archaeon]|nr:DUF1461 domain-containing protein [Candidatus Woesearchaeota archaeon]